MESTCCDTTSQLDYPLLSNPGDNYAHTPNNHAPHDNKIMSKGRWLVIKRVGHFKAGKCRAKHQTSPLAARQFGRLAGASHMKASHREG